MSDEKVAPIIICDIALLYNTDDRSSWVNHVIIIMSLLAVSLLQKIRFYARNLSRLHILLLKQTLFAITIQHNDAIVRARRHYTASLLAAATIQNVGKPCDNNYVTARCVVAAKNQILRS